MNDKNAGNTFFSQGDYPKAIEAYTCGINKIENAKFDPTGSRDPDSVLHILYSNRCQVRLNQELYLEAADDATRAIAVKKDFGKSYLRRARARAMLHELEGAVEDLTHVIADIPALKAEAMVLWKELEAKFAKKDDKKVWYRKRKEHNVFEDDSDDDDEVGGDDGGEGMPREWTLEPSPDVPEMSFRKNFSPNKLLQDQMKIREQYGADYILIPSKGEQNFMAQLVPEASMMFGLMFRLACGGSVEAVPKIHDFICQTDALKSAPSHLYTKADFRRQITKEFGIDPVTSEIVPPSKYYKCGGSMSTSNDGYAGLTSGGKTTTGGVSAAAAGFTAPTVKDCLDKSGKRSLYPCQPPFIDFKNKRLDPKFLQAFPEIKQNIGGASHMVDMIIANFFNQRDLDEGHLRKTGKWKHCDNCNKDLSAVAFPPNCVCGMVYCSPKCHKAAWKNHKGECAAIEDNNLMTFTFQRRFWDAVHAQMRVKWDPANPSTFSLMSEKAKGGATPAAIAGIPGMPATHAPQAQKILSWQPASDYRRDWSTAKPQWEGRGETELMYYLDKEREDCKRRVMATQSEALAKVNQFTGSEEGRHELLMEAEEALRHEFFGQFQYYIQPLEGDSAQRLFFRVLMVPSFLFYARNAWGPEEFSAFSTQRLPALLQDLSAALGEQKEFTGDGSGGGRSTGFGRRAKKQNKKVATAEQPFSPGKLAKFVLDQDASNTNNVEDMRNYFF